MTLYNQYINNNNVWHERKTEHTLTLEELHGLAEMAVKNVCPDGSFGDDHCVAWEIIMRAIRNGKKEE